MHLSLSLGPSPFFNRTSNCSLRQESNGDITWHVQSKGVPTSSLDKVPLKTSLYYTRNREHCRLFNDEGSHRELSKTKFEKTLLSFDRSLPFENRKAVVFYGSSSIRFWASLKSDFSNLPNGVINRGFGGSTLDDCWRQFKRLIVPLEPHALIIYVGENDRTSKRSAPQIELTFLELISTVRRFFPCIPIAYISIIPSLNPLDEFITRIEVNQRLRIAIESLPNVDYINVYDEMLTAEGAVRPELYDLDQLHMNEYGYAIWARVLTEYFETKRIAPSVDPSYAFWVAVIKLIIICQCVFGLMILYMRIRPRRWNHGIACRRLHRFCVRLIARRGLYWQRILFLLFRWASRARTHCDLLLFLLFVHLNLVPNEKMQYFVPRVDITVDLRRYAIGIFNRFTV